MEQRWYRFSTSHRKHNPRPGKLKIKAFHFLRQLISNLKLNFVVTYVIMLLAHAKAKPYENGCLKPAIVYVVAIY